MSPKLLLLVVLGSIAVFYLGLIWVLSRLTGWASLARLYAAESGEPAGERRSWEGARLKKWGNYNACLVIVLGPDGLYLRVFLPFSFGHRPLLIPWAKIRHLRDGAVLGQEVTFLEIDREGEAPLPLLIGKETWAAGARHRPS